MLPAELFYWTNFEITFLTLPVTLRIKKVPHFFGSVIVHGFSFPMPLNSALYYFMWGWPIFKPRLTRLTKK